MNKLFLVVCLLGMAMTTFAEKVKVDSLTFDVSPLQKEFIQNAVWAHAFRLENSSRQCGVYCLTGFVGNDYYIGTTDMVQGYIIRPSGLIKVTETSDIRYEDDNWGEYGGEQSVCYFYGYDKHDNIYVVVLATK